MPVDDLLGKEEEFENPAGCNFCFQKFEVESEKQSHMAQSCLVKQILNDPSKEQSMEVMKAVYLQMTERLANLKNENANLEKKAESD